MTFFSLNDVSGNAQVRNINGIQPSEFVLNNVHEVQMIYGTKTFEEDLIIEGNVTAPRVNDIEIIKEYSDGVQNDEDVDIFGNLVSITLTESFHFYQDTKNVQGENLQKRERNRN